MFHKIQRKKVIVGKNSTKDEGKTKIKLWND